MVIPQYTQGNIVNLMSSVQHGFGAHSPYPLLDKAITEEIQHAKTVLLCVIDGLGYDSVMKLGPKSFLRQHCVQRLSTVFPSTTAAAVTTFMTGLSPKEHGITGWFMNLQELGAVVAILPFVTRNKDPIDLGKKKLVFCPNIFDTLNAKTHIILKKHLQASPYNRYLSGKATFWGYNNLRGFFRQARRIVNAPSKKRQYVYMYWPEFDNFSHHLGKNHPTTQRHLRDIDKAVAHFAKQLEGTGTLLLLTADHGQMVTTLKKTIIINKHPLLKECLTTPLCGEPRAAFCYVHPQKASQFEKYVRHHFRDYCTLHRASELAKQGYFGLGKEHLRFAQRIGDYILLAKENYVFVDFLPGEVKDFHVGNHGGVSEEEMYIPLIKWG